MRASGASELENFHNYIHLPMQFLTITNTNFKGQHKFNGHCPIRYECAPSFRNLPTFVLSIKLCPIKGKKVIHWDDFPGSTVPIMALM